MNSHVVRNNFPGGKAYTPSSFIFPRIPLGLLFPDFYPCCIAFQVNCSQKRFKPTAFGQRPSGQFITMIIADVLLSAVQDGELTVERQQRCSNHHGLTGH